VLIRLLRLFAYLPLPVIHFLGGVAGWLTYWSSPSYAARMRENLRNSALSVDENDFQKLLHASIAETGKGATETFAVWFRKQEKVLQWVRECRGWQHVEDALAKKKGIIFLTPHLGCFEITALYYAARHPMSVLYRPPRKAWLVPLIAAGRSRKNIHLAPTNMQGVRSLLKALKQGEAIGILPDQVPSAGEGEWEEFFGKPAYTMTLVNKLAQTTGATVLMAFGERLPHGAGYIIHIETEDIASGLNATIERVISTRPEQYLWGYNRYKTPRGAPTKPLQ
jgi:KDO2-lipid IV(A) lauroyltransferase